MDTNKEVEPVNPYDAFLSDPDIEGEIGIKLEYTSIDGSKQYRVTVIHAGDGNKAYEAFIKRKRAPFEKTRRKMTDAEWLNILREGFTLHVIKNWECLVDSNWVPGIFDATGNVLTYTQDHVLETLTLAKRLFNDIIMQATDFGLFRKEVEAEVVKK